MGRLSEAEDRRHRFRQMLLAAEQETDRDGVFSLDEVLAEVDEIIKDCLSATGIEPANPS